MSIFEQAAGFIERHGSDQLALVTVVQTAGSTPRHPGTRMLVSKNGEIFHTIGGGRVEKALIDLARETTTASKGRVVTHHLVRDLAMCCGGSMTFLVEPLARSLATWKLVGQKLAAREPLKLTSSQGEPLSISAPRLPLGAPTLPLGAPTLPLGAPTGSRTWDGQQFSQTLAPRSRAILFGAGHIAQALIPLLRAAEFDIVLCDDNELGTLDQLESEWASQTHGAETPPEIELIPSFEVVDVRRQLGPIGAGDFAIIVTRDHAVDQRLVETILAGPPLSYVGLIGSLGKVGRFRRRIFAKGTLTDDQWNRLEAPMGLDIGAETPTEIAISICGRLIQERGRLRQSQRQPKASSANSSSGGSVHRQEQ